MVTGVSIKIELHEFLHFIHKICHSYCVCAIVVAAFHWVINSFDFLCIVRVYVYLVSIYCTMIAHEPKAKSHIFSSNFFFQFGETAKFSKIDVFKHQYNIVCKLNKFPDRFFLRTKEFKS